MAAVATNGGETTREARRRRIVERGSDRLALITGRIQSLPPKPNQSHADTCSADPIDSSQREDIGSGPSLPDQESAEQRFQTDIVDEAAEFLRRNSDKNRAMASRAVSLLGVEEEYSQMLEGLNPEKSSQDSSQCEDISSGPSLPDQESAVQRIQTDIVDEAVEFLRRNSDKDRSMASRAVALLGVQNEYSQMLESLKPEKSSQDSFQQEDIGSGVSLPNQESASGPIQHNNVNESVQPLHHRNLNNSRSIVSRAVSLLGIEEEFSSVQNIIPGLQPPNQQSQRNKITPRQIHSAISASENIRTCCSIAAAILVILSFMGFPMLSWRIFTSVVLSAPLHLLLLTNISIVIGRIVLGAVGTSQRVSRFPSFGGNGVVDQMGQVLELGLLLQKISAAFFMDFSIYAVVLICGFSLLM